MARSDEGSARSAEDGAFRVGGLAPGPYALFADRDARDDATAARWNARIESVDAGATDLVVTLRSPSAITGVVIDDAGAPVDAFQVTAVRADWPWSGDRSKEVSESFSAAEGRFTLAGLDDGAWDLSVAAEGHLTSDVVPLEVRGMTRHDEPFALTRTARITGQVLDPTGRPVARAEVRGLATGPVGMTCVEQTDDEGRFTLGSVGPGPIVLSADVDGWAPSTEELLDVQSGESLERQIRLNVGGRDRRDGARRIGRARRRPGDRGPVERGRGPRVGQRLQRSLPRRAPRARSLPGDRRTGPRVTHGRRRRRARPRRLLRRAPHDDGDGHRR